MLKITMKILKLTGFILTIFFCTRGVAQIQFKYPARFAQLNSGVFYRGWTLDRDGEKSEISETIFPLSVTSQFTDNLSLLFFTSHAGAVLNSGPELQGVVDGKVKAFYKIIPQTLLLNLGCSLPYGKNKFSSTEFEVANYLFEQILGFGVNRFGEGFDLDFGLSGAVPLGTRLNLGAGLGYLVKGEFEYLESTSQKLKPGNELSLTIGIDFSQDSLFIRGDILTKVYSRDKLAGDDFFQQGAQIEISSLAEYAAFPLRLRLLGRYIWKNDNQMFQTSEFLPFENANFIQNSFLSQFNVFYNFIQPLALFGEIGFQAFGASELQLGNASIVTIAGGLQYNFAEHALASLKLKYLTGSALEGNMAMRGREGSLGIQFRF